jgi:hypothetical protein
MIVDGADGDGFGVGRYPNGLLVKGNGNMWRRDGNSSSQIIKGDHKIFIVRDMGSYIRVTCEDNVHRDIGWNPDWLFNGPSNQFVLGRFNYGGAGHLIHFSCWDRVITDQETIQHIDWCKLRFNIV